MRLRPALAVARVPPSRIAIDTVASPTCSSGASPNTSPVSPATTTVSPSTAGSSVTSAARGMLSGFAASSALSPA